VTDDSCTSADEQNQACSSGDPATENVQARTVLGVRKLWIFPLAIPAVMIALVATIYIGSVVNPMGHLHDLPVLIVDQDAGATTPTGHVDLGQSLVQALLGNKEVTTYLDLQVLSLAQAEREMDRGIVYATLVVPSTFSASALLNAGYPSGVATPVQATVQLLENGRLGSLGVNLAAGVLTPALGQVSKQMGARLTAESTSAVRSNPVLANNLSDPLVLSVVSYRPLPSHSALGLSAFYVSLLSILAGFLAATAINSSVDGALGYATSDLGPRWKIRIPKRISRRRTLFAKWAIALVAAPLLTGIIVAVAVGAFGMYAPHFGVLWLLLTCATVMVSFGTLALLAALGNLGQLLAMVILIYLSLASSGGTIPIQALPSFFRVVGQIEPLRQLLGGTRDILYFGGQWHAGLAHALLVIGIELAVWIGLGVGFTSSYDRRKLYRAPPAVITKVERAVSQGAGFSR
jgi:YhgE/Pip-like protein